MIFGFDPSDDFDKSSGVTETLKNSFSMYNAWAGQRIRVSDWSEYFKDRKEFKGIDSSHIVTQKEQDILKKYFDGQNALSELAEGTEEYTQKSQELEKSLLGTSEKVKKLAEEGSSADIRVSKFADTFDKTSKSLSGFSKLASAAANIFTTFLISEGINLIIKGVQTLEEKNEKLVQSAQEVSDAYKDAQSSYSSNTKTLNYELIDKIKTAQLKLRCFYFKTPAMQFAPDQALFITMISLFLRKFSHHFLLLLHA